MAIVYSYPGATPTISDTVLGTQFDSDGNPTKSFPISDIVDLAVDAVTTNGASGVFLTNSNDIWQITVVDGIITDIELVG
jgi:hypothetical protein